MPIAMMTITMMHTTATMTRIMSAPRLCLARLILGLFLLLTCSHTATATATAKTGACATAQQPQSLPMSQWGTFRPNLYFGTRLGSPDSLLTGLAWFSLNDNDYAGLQSMRHACDQAHNMQGYGFHVHNGRDYANQTINDPALNLALSTEWIARHDTGDWVVRIRGQPLDRSKPLPKVGVLYYAGFDGPGSLSVGSGTQDDATDRPTAFVQGSSPNLGEFAMYVQAPPASVSSSVSSPWAAVAASPAWARSGPRVASLPMPAGKVWQAADLAAQVLSTHARATIAQRQKQGEQDYPDPADLIALPERNLGLGQDQAIAAVIQMAFQGTWEMDVSFVSRANGRETHDLATAAALDLTTTFTDTATARTRDFRTRFSATFPLPPTLPPSASKLSHYLLSNLLGGIGFFHGPSRINPSPDNEAAVFDWLYLSDPDDEDAQLAHAEWKAQRETQTRETPPLSLFTATPSRSFFPRGFLWDEGFHQLVVGAWDPELSKQVLASWFAPGVQDKETGWIAREQILGQEARSRVPQEFQVQSPHIANPPTLGLAVMALVDQHQRLTKEGLFSDSGAEQRMVGGWSKELIPPDSSNELIRSFLSSLHLHYKWMHATQHGIPDDFGRAIPNPYVYRWRGRTEYHNFASGLDDYPRYDPPNIGELHLDLQAWMAWYARLIADLAERVGDNALAADMRAQAEATAANLFNVFWDPARGGFGDVAINYDDESIVYVRKGYVSLVPFVLGLVDKTQHKKPFDWSIQLIRELSRPGNGVLSLHPDDEAFGKGENYWRGAVWMNWQYLVLRALKRSGPEVQDLYAKIRGDVIRIVTKGFEETGFVHENYDGLTGKPRGSHPFTGWTSLVLLIMAERYH